MNSISLQEVAHKNVILWKLMSKHGFKALVVRRNAIKNDCSFSLVKEIAYYDRRGQLMFLDEKLAPHVYRSSIAFPFDKLSFFPTTSSKDIVYARAAFLDALVENFKHGFRWRSFVYYYKTVDAISDECIDIDLNFNEHDIMIEKSIIDCIELHDRLNTSLPF